LFSFFSFAISVHSEPPNDRFELTKVKELGAMSFFVEAIKSLL